MFCHFRTAFSLLVGGFCLLGQMQCLPAEGSPSAREASQPADANYQGLAVQRLCCESRVNPTGIDVLAPHLSWVVTSPRRGEALSTSQVLVATSPDLLAKDTGDLWDSGKLPPSPSVTTLYAGNPLASRLVCYWKVRVWSQSGEASAWSPVAIWSMGLLRPTDWQARWISDPTLADPANRPLSPINCYRSELASRPDAVKWIILDLGTAKHLDGIDIIPARREGLSSDLRTPMFPLRFRVEAADNRDFLDAKTLVDQTEADVVQPRETHCAFHFPATMARFVRLTVTRLSCWDAQDYGLALGGIHVSDGPTVVSTGAQVTCSDSLETAQCSKSFLVNARSTVNVIPDFPAVAARMPDVPAGQTVSRVPMLRREFALDGEIRRAVLTATARGFYEMRINGRKVGDQLLAPGCTDYWKTVQCQSQDVTALLRRGPNAIAALLGYGWYAGHMNLFSNRCFYGYFPQLLAQLDIELTDGRRVTVVSDENWRSTLNGPVRSSDLLDGEACDLRRGLPGWDQPGFDDQSWNKAWSQPRDGVAIAWQRCQPVRATREIHPVAMRETAPGVYVYDFGQEITGWCRLQAAGPAGTHVRLRHAEEVSPNGSINVANLWGTAQQDDYLLDGSGPRTLEPHFTYHGFRYVELTGLPQPPTADTLVAINLHSDLPEVGSFECSNPLFNRIMTAARWTQWNLLFDLPAGCAARSERLGWLGDIRPCVQTLCFNLDAAAFLTKYARDMREAQTPEGRFCDISPHAHLDGTQVCVGSPGWADAGVSLPWQTWVNYGDRGILEQQFAAAKRWVDYIHQHNPGLRWEHDRGMDWGDWLSAGPATPKDLGATAFFAHDADLLSRMAAVLGRRDEAASYRALFEGIRQAFVKRWVSSDGVIDGPGQNAEGVYAMALQFDLLDEPLRTKAADQLCQVIVRDGNHPTTGFWSSVELLLALSAHGHHEEAARLLAREDQPSWGYMVDHGTTFWESFDAPAHGLSLNHWTHSAVGEWLWRNVAGINPEEDQPGYRAVTIRPRPCDEVRWCKAKVASVRGDIAVDWHLDGSRFALDLTVPVTTTAHVFVPASAPSAVMEGHQPAVQAEGIKFLRMEDKTAVFEVLSGKYHFESTE